MNERIRRLRKTLDMTQQEFADKLGVKRNTVGQWECGINGITDQVAISICREFNVNENWLRTGEGEMLMHLSREEEIMRFAATVIRDPSSEFQRRFVSVLARLTPEQWQLMEEMARKLLQEQPEEPPTDAK